MLFLLNLSWELWLKYLSVFAMSAVKFVWGVGLGVGFGLNFAELLLSTLLGGVAGIVVFTYFGEAIGRLWKRIRRKPEGTKGPSERMLRLWERYGLWGTTLLTPILLTPPGGTALALMMGTPRHKVIVWLSAGIVAYGLAFALLLELVGEPIRQLLH